MHLHTPNTGGPSVSVRLGYNEFLVFRYSCAVRLCGVSSEISNK